MRRSKSGTVRSTGSGADQASLARVSWRRPRPTRRARSRRPVPRRQGRGRGPGWTGRAGSRQHRPSARYTMSEKKQAASRSNGARSRGPRTALGKRNASRNALRHGFAALSHRNTVSDEIYEFARMLCTGDNNPDLFEPALVIAENNILVGSIRAEGVAVVEGLRGRTATAL